MRNSDNKIIITGASGWLGRNLLNALIYGSSIYQKLPMVSAENITILLNSPEEEHLFKNFAGIKIVYGDIRSKSTCSQLLLDGEGALIFHTAGIIHPNLFSSDFNSINFQGTVNLVTAAIDTRAKRIIAISSNSAFGFNQDNKTLFTEKSPYNPYMKYGQSKVLMEEYIKQIHNDDLIETVIIRVPWFYGPFQPDRQATFYEMIKNGKVPVVGDGSNKRSMVYTENLVQGCILSAYSSVASGKAYWISDKNPYSMNEIITTIASVLSNDFQIRCIDRKINLPLITSDIARHIDTAIQSFGLYNKKIHVLSEMSRSICCDPSLAIDELFYDPKIELRDGIRNSVQWMVDNNIKLN